MSETYLPTPTVGRGRSFHSITEENPCSGCSAPCCRILLTPHPTPNSFSDLDYIRYVLAFPGTEMVVYPDGRWQLASHKQCSLLDNATSLCTVHGTPRKPKVCVHFDPYRCWYKRNFTTDDAPDIVRLNAGGFERVLEVCAFDDDGVLQASPTWEQLRELAHASPVEVTA